MILSQTTETVKEKKPELLWWQFTVFGDILQAPMGGGKRAYFGLDAVSDVYIGFEYGVCDDLNIDIGRTTIGGLADLELKYAILRQSRDGSSPFAITLPLAKHGVTSIPGSYVVFRFQQDSLSYLAQAIFANRKLAPWISRNRYRPLLCSDNSPPLVISW